MHLLSTVGNYGAVEMKDGQQRHFHSPLASAQDLGWRVNLEEAAMRPTIDLSSLTSLWNGVDEGTTCERT